ncbi:MAG: hypothetical protein C0404_05350 [Verrucomicrobia bacterium]|nr:hypothetical protein [Verrucomicrobiota bacterium]
MPQTNFCCQGRQRTVYMTEEGNPQVEEDAMPAQEVNPAILVGEIEKALAEAEGRKDRIGDNSFEFPLSTALGLIPRQYIREDETESVEGESILVSVKNIFDQLAMGKAEVSVADLSFFIPLNLIYRAALEDPQVVRLPLQTVVRSIGLLPFKKRTPQEMRFYDIAGLDDPFKEGEAEPEESAGVIFEDEPQPEPAAQTGEGGQILAEPQAREFAETESAIQAPPADALENAALRAEGAPPPAPPRSTAAADSGNSFEYSIAQALAVLPQEHVAASAAAAAGSAKVRIVLPDLFDQLKRGKVTVPVSAIVGILPRGLVSEEALKDPASPVVLPLRSVAEAVGMESLKRFLPAAVRQYDIDRMADPFKEPDVLPKLLRSSEHAKHKETAENAPAAGASAESLMTSATTVSEHTAVDMDLDLSFRELPGNVNLNATTVEELSTLPCVTMDLANAIVDYIATNGMFKSIFDLMEVPGMDAKIFQGMTGMDAGPNRYHRRNRLAALLKLPPQKVSDLHLVAQTIAGKSGFSGCIISDGEGLILAQSGAGKLSGSLSAVLPRMLRQIGHNMELAGADEVDALSLSLHGKFYTIAGGGNVMLTAIHSSNLISETELSFVRKVCKDLAWLLSFRAFAGPAG